MLKTKRKTLILAVIALSSLLALLLCLLLIPKKAPENQPPERTAPTEPSPPPMLFDYKNGYLTCLTAESVLGIDVSSHQQEIDWEQVKASGVQYVMLRIGYRGLDLGGLYEDEYAQRNYEGAKKAGLQVGGYFFSQAVTPEEALEEADFALSLTKDWEFDMPLVFDWEYSGEENRVANMTSSVLMDCITAFCGEVEKAGRTPMVYFNPDLGRTLLNMESLSRYPLWLAMYTESYTYEHPVDMWQYTCTGSVPGIAGNVDINLYFPQEPLA